MQKTLEPGTLVKYIGDIIDFKDGIGRVLDSKELKDDKLVLVRVDRKNCTCIFNVDNLEVIEEIPVIDSDRKNIGSVTEIYKDDSRNTIANVQINVIEEAAQVHKEAWDNLIPELQFDLKKGSDGVCRFIPKGSNDHLSELTKVYQNLRLGGVDQADILSAVAKLKAAGLSVEFIE